MSLAIHEIPLCFFFFFLSADFLPDKSKNGMVGHIPAIIGIRDGGIKIIDWRATWQNAQEGKNLKAEQGERNRLASPQPDIKGFFFFE